MNSKSLVLASGAALTLLLGSLLAVGTVAVLPDVPPVTPDAQPCPNCPLNPDVPNPSPAPQPAPKPAPKPNSPRPH